MNKKIKRETNKKMHENQLLEKFKRCVTATLPISEKRKGRCVNCGACCKFALKCPFLKTDEKGKTSCKIYKIRPLQCRKYPRTEKEWIKVKTCGHYFENESVDNKSAESESPKNAENKLFENAKHKSYEHKSPQSQSSHS